MPMNFPDTPTNGQTFTSGGVVWAWNGTAWNPTSTPGAGGASTVTIGDVAPPNPAPGNLWWNSSPSDGQLYIQYNDGTSTQWVTTNNFSGGGLYLPLTGGTLTGPLVINASATAPQPGPGMFLAATEGTIPPYAILDSYTASPGLGGGLVGRRTRGTAAAPTAVQNSDNLLSIYAQGWGASGFGTGATIIVNATQVWTATAQGAVIALQAAAPNTTTLQTVGTFATTGCQIQGTTTNDNAPAGFVGEVVSAVVTTGVAAASGTTITIASITLSAGDWDVMAEVVATPGAQTSLQLGISSVAATLPAAPSLATALVIIQLASGGVGYVCTPVGPCRQSLAASQTFYLVGQQSGGTGVTISGKIWARRRR